MKLSESLRAREANHRPLTPAHFLWHAAANYPDKVAVIDGDRNLTYREFADFARRMAAQLEHAGVGRGDVVSLLGPNSPEMLAAHFAVPAIGAVLNTLNTRLDAQTTAYILEHVESNLLIADSSHLQVVTRALTLSRRQVSVVWLRPELLSEPPAAGESFAQFMENATGRRAQHPPEDRIQDEWQPICVNYTSGTTGRPKGVVYHHRGAFLNSVGNVMALGFAPDSVYLWVLPMFHCNGWMHAWAVTAAAGTHVCLDRVEPAQILRTIEAEGVTHLACAPVVLYMLINDPSFAQLELRRRVKIATGGAAPTAELIASLERVGFELIHLYGLTESYGPTTLCSTPPELATASAEEKAARLARQGLPHALASSVQVIDESGAEVPLDGATLGEIRMRGNTLMAGYYKDDAATEQAFAGGAFRTGDLAVRHANGQIEIRDRAKDIIISGGENIASLEVESVLQSHPAVLLAAVVAMPHDKWGEVPCAFVELKPGVARPDANELVAHCRAHLASFKVPKRIEFAELPRTATGKIQKFALRARVRAAPT